MSGAKFLAVFLTLCSLGAYWIYDGALASQREIPKPQTSSTTGGIAENSARELELEAHKKWLEGLSEDELRLAGQRCADRLTERLDIERGQRWFFVHWDPFDFSGLETASLMGMKLSAHGSSTTGYALANFQLPALILNRETGGVSDQFRFVVSEPQERGWSIKEVLSLHVCRLTGPSSVEIYKAKELVL
ncbi:hypothetical protein AB9K35_17710 [Leisingera sp. XS_AS12]|uniref:hypothetical protein n=1 Tax=Leisingera sp. XS_AS12 TaxID=3241294 RepID=UPI00351611EB